MSVLYNIGVHLYGFGIRIASLFNPKAKLWVSGRKGLFTSFPTVPKSKEVIWMHCASLGEFDQGLPVLTRLRNQYPEHFILVTFFSPSGMQHYHKREHSADHVCYLPLDTPSNARKFVEAWNPAITIFVKYEFWSNHILEVKRSGSKLYAVSALFRNDHRFFKWYGDFFRKTLQAFDWIFVQNNESGELLKSIDYTQFSVTGDNRFDRVIENKQKATKLPVLDAFCDGRSTFIIGSSWPQDEEILIPLINEGKHKVIIAPHNVDEKHVKGITSRLTVPFVTITECSTEDASNAHVLIMNTIGQLTNAYSYGTFAYVGGGFSGSLHNILEPAVFGLPVIFGPKYDRFPEAQQFINAGFGFSVSSTSELSQIIRSFSGDIAKFSEKAAAFVELNTGASDKILEKITSS